MDILKDDSQLHSEDLEHISPLLQGDSTYVLVSVYLLVSLDC